MKKNKNKPLWWQAILPHYGNWGGPGWSSGCWCPPEKTDWSAQGIDDMDALFKIHDHHYQTGKSRYAADYDLVKDLKKTNVKGFYANFYRISAILVFSIRLFFMSKSK